MHIHIWKEELTFFPKNNFINGSRTFILQTVPLKLLPIKKKREKTQINKIRNETGEITMDTTETQNITKDNYKQLYTNKMDNL